MNIQYWKTFTEPTRILATDLFLVVFWNIKLLGSCSFVQDNMYGTPSDHSTRYWLLMYNQTSLLTITARQWFLIMFIQYKAYEPLNSEGY